MKISGKGEDSTRNSYIWKKFGAHLKLFEDVLMQFKVTQTKAWRKHTFQVVVEQCGILKTERNIEFCKLI